MLPDLNNAAGESATLKDPRTPTRRALLMLAGAAGGAAVGFNAELNYVAKTIGKSLSDREWLVTDFPWLAKFDGTTNDSAAIKACMTALYNAGGGTAVMPKGTAVASIDFNWADTIGVNLRGQGKRATFLKSPGAAPVLDFSSPTSVLDICSEFRDFAIRGVAYGGAGMRITNIASFTFKNVDIRKCDVAVENRGSLTGSFHNCTIQDNHINYRSSAYNGIYANLIQFHGTRFAFGTTFGVDLGECSGVNFHGCDFERNGTPTLTNTGAVTIRSNVSNETGYATITFTGTCWFEQNYGTAFASSGGALALTHEGSIFLASEGGRAMDVGPIQSVTLIGVIAPGASDVVTLAASHSTVIGGTIATLTDTSTHQTRIGLNTIAGATAPYFKTLQVGSGGISLDAAAKITSGATFSQGAPIAVFQDGQTAGNAHGLFHSNGSAGNAAGTGFRVGTNSTTGRSINAGGTVNASGADYAEYEFKRDDCGVIQPGDVCGFDSAGLLTDRWALAVSFGIKSTAPCMVGGDIWGEGLEGEELEAARARVDRIAYAGKCPVNMSGAAPGAWIDAAEGPGGSITAIVAGAPGERTVGRVRSVLPDGRPVVVVRAA